VIGAHLRVRAVAVVEEQRKKKKKEKKKREMGERDEL
jgi:hypothetical protein